MKEWTSGRVCFLALVAMLSSVTANGEDWYRWRGPDLNGISKETGWQANWPQEGPKQLWKASVGTGFSSFAVKDGRVYAMGNTGDKDTVYCLDAETGKEVWKHTYDCPLDPNLFEGGPSSTPTVDGDRVYTFSRKGHVFCLDAKKGNVVWSKNLVDELKAKIPTWGFSGSPYVQDGLVILNVGSAGIGIEKGSGKIVWSSGTEVPGYSTPVPFKSGGADAVVIFASKSVLAVNVKDGKKLWEFPWKTSYDVNAADPIVAKDEVFISSGYNRGAALIKVSDNKPTLIWENKNMRNHFNSSVLWKDYLYGVDEGELKCVEFKTGSVKWGDKKFGKGSLMMADGKLVALSEKGELIIAEAAPAAFTPISRAQVLGGRCWTAPVLSNGRIYCRNAKGDMVCLSVGK